MNKFQIAELLADLNNRLESIESKFNIRDHDFDKTQLWLKNARLALEIDDEKDTSADECERGKR
jgi:hypothetical protein